MSDIIAAWYWTITLMVFVYWFLLFYNDQSTPKNDLVSWTFLIITPFFWPIVLPISSWELSRKALKSILI